MMALELDYLFRNFDESFFRFLCKQFALGFLRSIENEFCFFFIVSKSNFSGGAKELSMELLKSATLRRR